MNFDIVRDSKFIYHVRADGVVVGEIGREISGKWVFHYRAAWPIGMIREDEIVVWKLIDDQKNILNITSRLKG